MSDLIPARRDLIVSYTLRRVPFALFIVACYAIFFWYASLPWSVHHLTTLVAFAIFILASTASVLIPSSAFKSRWLQAGRDAERDRLLERRAPRGLLENRIPDKPPGKGSR